MTERAIHLGLLIASVAAAGWAFVGHARDPSTSAALAAAERRESPLAIIPPGSAFVMHADVTRLARSPLGGYFAQRLARVRGASDLTDLCGFEPLTRLSELALAVPSAGSVSEDHAADFGIVAKGQFSGGEITRCANAVIAERSGKATESSIGSFASVRDQDGRNGEIAAKDGLLIMSGGSYFRALPDSADSRERQVEGPPRRAARRPAWHARLGRCRRDMAAAGRLVRTRCR